MKTFWGWSEKQLADGTLILTSPAGQTYVTTPGSALLFPSLCYSVGGCPPGNRPPVEDYCGQRSATMPKRRRTRAQDHASRVATERDTIANARIRPTARKAVSHSGPAPPDTDDEPPPF